MHTCFVIQRFDGGAYDKRFRETFAPAIERAGAKPVRADEVLGTRPIIDKIEEGLRSTDVAFAEVSEDNPNVFLELGFALALAIPTVIACDKAKRQRLPFDIAHRPIHFYSTDAQSDYEKAAKAIEGAIAAALLETRNTTTPAVNNITNTDMDDVKSACLIALLDQSLRSPAGSTVWEVQQAVAPSGISDRMTTLALMSLVDNEMIERSSGADENGDPYNSFTLSHAGSRYMLRSYSDLMQQERNRVKSIANSAKRGGFGDDSDDTPF